MTENKKHVDVNLENTLNSKVGDSLEIEIPEKTSERRALVAYILPLVPGLALMFVALALNWKEWVALLMFVGGLVVGYALLVVIDRLRHRKWMQTPTMKSICYSVAEQKQQ